MKETSVILLMLVSTTMLGQAFNCGVFGIIEDDFGNGYVGRFDMTLDSVELESMATCNVFTSPITVWDINNGKRWTRVWMDIKHPSFDETGYKIKYPTGSWQIIRQRNNVPAHCNWWPVEPAFDN
tara:strand:- start:293 stop:667 length:375 start_codon:yes stop_codon:yes gene_type:complete